MSQSTLKSKLFDLTQSNISELIGSDVDFIICPGCLRTLNKSHLASVPHEVCGEQIQVEDAPSRQVVKNIGISQQSGRRCLTCLKCNSTAGNGYESDIGWLQSGPKFNLTRFKASSA